jgi:hypothetical protein
MGEQFVLPSIMRCAAASLKSKSGENSRRWMLMFSMMKLMFGLTNAYHLSFRSLTAIHVKSYG